MEHLDILVTFLGLFLIKGLLVQRRLDKFSARVKLHLQWMVKKERLRHWERFIEDVEKGKLETSKGISFISWELTNDPIWPTTKRSQEKTHQDIVDAVCLALNVPSHMLLGHVDKNTTKGRGDEHDHGR